MAFDFKPFGGGSESLIWEGGSVDAVLVSFDEDSVGEGAESLAALLDEHPVRELVVGAKSSWDWEEGLAPVVQAIARRERPQLRELGLYGCDSDLLVFRDDNPPVDLGNLGPLWARLPNLEALSLHSMKLTLGQLQLPNVREAEISVGDTDEDFLKAMSERWPSLERLAIDLGDPQFTSSDATDDDLVRILGNMPRLHHLALLGFCPIDEFVTWLIGSPLMGELETLAILSSPMSDDAAGMLLHHKSDLRRLRRLRLDGTDISVGLHSELRELCPDASVTDYFDWDQWRQRF